jgi:CysZ protein
MSRAMALDFHSGLLFWLRGWGHLLRRRRLLAAAAAPITISTGAAAATVWLLWTHLPHWVHTLVSWVGLRPGWTHEIFYYPLLVSSALLALFSSIYVMYLSQSVIAVPFYSYLADRTLGQLGKKPEIQRTWKQWILHSLSMIRVSLIKLIVLVVVGAVLFGFSFLPVLNVFALIGALMILALDCMDYSLDALGLGFRARMGYYARNWAQWLGMALGLGLTLLIPGFTLLIIPGAVVGAAIIVKNERR